MKHPIYINPNTKEIFNINNPYHCWVVAKPGPNRWDHDLGKWVPREIYGVDIGYKKENK